MTFTLEQIKKAKQAKSAEELLAIAKASGVELTEEEAAKYFSELHKEGELSDEELDNVVGGKGEVELPPQKYAIDDSVFYNRRWFTVESIYWDGKKWMYVLVHKINNPPITYNLSEIDIEIDQCF